MAVEAHSHKDIRDELSQIRKEHAGDIERICHDMEDIGAKVDAQMDKWMTWSEAQWGKQEDFRSELAKTIDSVRGAVSQKEAMDTTLLAVVQRIEKQFDLFATARDRDLKEMYTMSAKVKEHEKDVAEAHNKIRRLELELPKMIKAAVADGLKEQERKTFVAIMRWMLGIIAAIIAEAVVLMLTR